MVDKPFSTIRKNTCAETIPPAPARATLRRVRAETQRAQRCSGSANLSAPLRPPRLRANHLFFFHAKAQRREELDEEVDQAAEPFAPLREIMKRLSAYRARGRGKRLLRPHRKRAPRPSPRRPFLSRPKLTGSGPGSPRRSCRAGPPPARTRSRRPP